MKKQLLLITGLLLTTVLFCDIGGNQSQYREIICTKMNITDAKESDTCEVTWYYELVEEAFKEKDFTKFDSLFFLTYIIVVQHATETNQFVFDTIYHGVNSSNVFKSKVDSIIFIPNIMCTYTIIIDIQLLGTIDLKQFYLSTEESWLTHIIVNLEGVKVRDSDITKVNIVKGSKVQ